MKTKFVSILITILILALALVSCGSSNNNSNNSNNNSSNAHSHYFGEWQTVTSATCQNTGKQVRYCSCGYSQTDTISTLSHSWVNATCNAPKTCSICNTTEGDKLEHQMKDGICSICKYKDPIAEEFEKGNSVYAILLAVNVQNEKIGNAIYRAWDFSINGTGKIPISSDGISTLANVIGYKEEVLRSAAITHLINVGYKESEIDKYTIKAAVSSFSHCVAIVLQMFKDSGYLQKIEEDIAEANSIIKSMSSEYESTTKLSILMDLYSNTVLYYNFVSSPSGSFSTLSSTLNSYKTAVMDNLNRLQFTYAD